MNFTPIYHHHLRGKFDHYNECELNNKRIRYSACATGDLEKAKEFYPRWQYIGSGYITYHDGVRNENTELHHFFK